MKVDQTHPVMGKSLTIKVSLVHLPHAILFCFVLFVLNCLSKLTARSRRAGKPRRGVYSGSRSSPSSSSANSSSSRRFLAPVLGLSAWGPRGSTYDASAQDRR